MVKIKSLTGHARLPASRAGITDRVHSDDAAGHDQGPGLG